MKYNIIDSRAVIAPTNTTFYAIHTETNNGHKYIPELYNKGVRSFVIDEEVPFLSDKQDTTVIRVKNVLEELQKEAQAKRRSMKETVYLGIIGSRGKTIVKEWLHSLLPSSDRSPRSFNSQIGVPLSILDIDEKCKYAIIEAGVSKRGEMKSLGEIISPEVVIFTSITDEHSEGFASKREKIEEKLKIVNSSSKIVYHLENDDLLTECINAKIKSENQYTWSTKNKDAYLYVTKMDIRKDYTMIDFTVEGKTLKNVKIPFTTDYETEDAITAITAAYLLEDNVNLEMLSQLQHIDTRIDVIDGLNNCILLYDKFTNDIKSLIPALDFATRRLTADRTVSLILHLPATTYYEELLANEEFKAYVDKFSINCIFVKTVSELMNLFQKDDFVNQVILVKGEPSSGFDSVISTLERKQHETVMEVNLDNVVFNYNFFRSKLKPETGIICMLKAAGYGTGSLQLAKTLQLQGAYAIAVAVIDEGIELRKAGITMPIIVLNPRADDLKLMFENKLEPEVYNIDILSKIIAVADANGIKEYPIHLKLDTGMHRLGFNLGNLNDAINILLHQNNLKLATTFSHLATADCLDMNDYTQSQLDLFEKMVEILKNNIPYRFKAHILNTAGILRYPQYQHELVRLGIGLYGIAVVNDGSEKELRPVASLYSTIIEISDRKPGDTIGYSRKGKILRQSKIATVPIGYADGLDRHLGNGNAKFYINGVLCPIIGNICMDICMVDVTDCDCRLGDRVEIFGPHIPVTALSDTLGTIPYEILTSISERVKRVYFRE